jgi:hypothetical protein
MLLQRKKTNKKKGAVMLPFFNLSNMTEIEVKEIEERLVKKDVDKLSILPRPIRRQLSRMKDSVLTIWKLDTIYSGKVQLQMFQAVSGSTMTLNELQLNIAKNGMFHSKKPFEKYLTLLSKEINKRNKKIKK